MVSDPQQQVRRRRVFYIPGYDPIHPRRYRELYRKEGAAQAEISGYQIALTPKSGDGPYGWNVVGQIDDATVDAQVEVLVWSDIVRDSMSNTIPATYVQMLRTAWTYIGSGALWRLKRLRKGPVIAALYPVGMLICQAALAILAFLAVFLIAETLFVTGLEVLGGEAKGADGKLIYQLSLLIGIGAGYLLLRWFKSKDHALYVYYLMHDYAFSAQYKGAYPPALERRMAEFTELLAKAVTEDVDEVLVVGHSSGAYVGISVLADLIRAGRVPTNGASLGFLSLGQVVPMVSFLPDAHRLRTDLRYLSARDELSWVDVTAPGDGCTFALCDPVAVSGVSPKDKKWPLVISAAFTQTLSPARWAALRWRFFRLHFQYLCAFDQPGDYDYFRITAGPLTLGSRFAGRAASRSRIEASVSKYTAVAE